MLVAVIIGTATFTVYTITTPHQPQIPEPSERTRMLFAQMDEQIANTAPVTSYGLIINEEIELCMLFLQLDAPAEYRECMDDVEELRYGLGEDARRDGWIAERAANAPTGDWYRQAGLVRGGS